ncbi:hypothetical protein MUO65_05210, partial [bacterium]|nr:hypothetical protein [bacterium]
DAERLLEANEDFVGAAAKVEEAIKYIAPSEESRNLLNRIRYAQRQKTKYTEIDTSFDGIKAGISVAKIDIEDLDTFLEKVEVEIKNSDAMDWKDYGERLKVKAEKLKSSISSKKESIGERVERNKTRVTNRLAEIRGELSRVEQPKDIVALKKNVSAQENYIKNIPSKDVKTELSTECRELKVEIDTKANKAVEAKIKEIPQSLQEVDGEIFDAQILEDTRAIRERLNAINRGITQVLLEDEKARFKDMYDGVSTRLSEKHAELKRTTDNITRRIRNALERESKDFYPKYIEASKAHLQELREQLGEIPSTEAQDELRNEIDETEGLMDETRKEYEKTVAQKKRIIEIDIEVRTRINIVKNWRVTGRNGMLESGVTPEDLAKPALELLGCLDTTVPIAKTYYDRNVKELNTAIAAKNKALQEAKEELEASRPERERHEREETEERALTILGEIDSRIGERATHRELRDLEKQISEVDESILSRLSQEQRSEIEDEQKSMRDKIEAILSKKQEAMTAILNGLPERYTKTNTAIKNLLTAKINGDKEAEQRALKKVTEMVSKENIDPQDWDEHYKEAVTFLSKPGFGSLEWIRDTRFAKSKIGKALGFDNYSPFLHASWFEEVVKVGGPLVLLGLLNQISPWPPLANLLIYKVVTTIFGVIFTLLHIFNRRAPPKGIINKIRFCFTEIRRLTPKERCLIFGAPFADAVFGIALSMTVVTPPSFSQSLAMVGLSSIAHLCINLVVAFARALGIYASFATIHRSKAKVIPKEHKEDTDGTRQASDEELVRWLEETSDYELVGEETPVEPQIQKQDKTYWEKINERLEKSPYYRRLSKTGTIIPILSENDEVFSAENHLKRVEAVANLLARHWKQKFSKQDTKNIIFNKDIIKFFSIVQTIGIIPFSNAGKKTVKEFFGKQFFDDGTNTYEAVKDILQDFGDDNGPITLQSYLQ